MDNQNRNKYYAKFGLREFLNAKDGLKSLPVFLNNIYFLKTYGNALWNADKEEIFENVIVVCNENKLDKLKSIIKTNFLYRNKWDSTYYTNEDNYGFSFIINNVKIIVGTYKKEDNNAIIKLFDVNTNIATLTKVNDIENTFLTTSINDKGEIIKLIDFDLNSITDDNTTKIILNKDDNSNMITLD